MIASCCPRLDGIADANVDAHDRPRNRRDDRLRPFRQRRIVRRGRSCRCPACHDSESQADRWDPLSRQRRSRSGLRAYKRGCSLGAHSDARLSSMNPVCHCPLTNSGWESKLSRNSRLLETPEIRNSDKARRAFAVTVLKSRRRDVHDDLREQRIETRIDAEAAVAAGVDAHARPCRQIEGVQYACRGADDAIGRHGLRVHAQLHRHAAR